MKAKASKFIEWIESMVGSPYLWGGQGETIFGILRKHAKQLGQSEAANDKMIEFLMKSGVVDKHFFDCSGLGVSFLIAYGAIKKDMTADGLYRQCSLIEKKEVRAGDFVFFVKDGRASHVGYMVTDDTVVHALDQEVGVIREELSARKGWNGFGRPEFCIEYDLKKPEVDYDNLKAGDKITTTKDLRGYTNADNAVKGVKPVCTYSEGTYYVFKVYKGAVNITKHKGIAGAWVNLNQ